MKKYQEKGNDSPFWKYYEKRHVAYLNKVGLDYPPNNPLKNITRLYAVLFQKN
jgi:hypothetical protein